MNSYFLKHTSSGRSVNGHGKCLASSQNWSNNGNKLIIWDCLNELGQFWFFLGDGHICNGHWKCIASSYNSYGNENLIQYGVLNEQGQKWQWFNGNQIIYLWGKCLATAENSNGRDARVVGWTCFDWEQGQRWRFEKFP